LPCPSRWTISPSRTAWPGIAAPMAAQAGSSYTPFPGALPASIALSRYIRERGSHHISAQKSSRDGRRVHAGKPKALAQIAEIHARGKTRTPIIARRQALTRLSRLASPFSEGGPLTIPLTYFRQPDRRRKPAAAKAAKKPPNTSRKSNIEAALPHRWLYRTSISSCCVSYLSRFQRDRHSLIRVDHRR
jgi:hypothetical protein